MCLALPGLIVERTKTNDELPFAQVAFGTARTQVCLAYTPQAKVGDYVLVHVGFAIQVLDEHAAQRTLELLEDTPDQ